MNTHDWIWQRPATGLRQCQKCGKVLSIKNHAKVGECNGMKIHELKTWQEPFGATLRGVKAFEYRFNDRNFRIGQYLNLREYDPIAQEYSGRSLKVRIKYILYGGKFGIPKDYCIMSISTII